MNLINFAKKNGADDVAIRTICENTTQVKFANSSLSVAQNWLTKSHSIFVAVGKKTASSAFHGLTDKQLEAAVKNLVSAAKNSKPNSEYSGLATGPFRYKIVDDIYDKKAEDYDPAAAIEVAL